MGVKSTVVIERKDAETMFLGFLGLDPFGRVPDGLMTLNNKALERILEILNDEANDGEGFENYMIKATGSAV